MLLLACLRGNIFVYYGEELGLTQVEIDYEDLRDPEAIANWPLTLSRDGARTPMPWVGSAPGVDFTTGKPWLPVGEDHRAMAVDRQSADPRSMLSFTREALALRRAHSALSTGGIEFIATTETLLAFERIAEGERLLCAFNLGPDREELAALRGDNWRILISTGEVDGSMLGAYSALVAEWRG
jgi:alpha-glucosidase